MILEAPHFYAGSSTYYKADYWKSEYQFPFQRYPLPLPLINHSTHQQFNNSTIEQFTPCKFLFRKIKAFVVVRLESIVGYININPFPKFRSIHKDIVASIGDVVSPCIDLNQVVIIKANFGINLFGFSCCGGIECPSIIMIAPNV